MGEDGVVRWVGVASKGHETSGGGFVSFRPKFMRRLERCSAVSVRQGLLYASSFAGTLMQLPVPGTDFCVCMMCLMRDGYRAAARGKENELYEQGST